MLMLRNMILSLSSKFRIKMPTQNVNIGRNARKPYILFYQSLIFALPNSVRKELKGNSKDDTSFVYDACNGNRSYHNNVVHSPLRNLIILGLDRLKQGRGLVTSRTVAATLFTVFVFNLYGILKTQKRVIEVGSSNPTDQVLVANRVLEASLMGFCLFLGLMIDRLHYYVKELWSIRKSLKAVRDSNLTQPGNKNKKTFSD